MRRVFYIIILALLPLAGSAQSIADLARKAEIEKNPLHIYSNVGTDNHGLYIVRKDNDEEGTYAYGVADDDGTVYVSVEYDQIEFATKGSEYKDNVYKCEKNGKWGLVSSANGILLPCEYRSLINYGNGIWRISTSGRCGYAKLNGTSSATTLIPCIYESLGHYSSLIHATFQGKKGMIDGQNNIVIPFEYSTVSDLCHAGNGNGIMWVEKNGKHGIYNDKGQIVQSCDIDRAYTLTESNSAMELSYTNCPPDDYIYIVRSGLTGVMSGSTYETLVPCMYEYLSPVKAGKAFYKANGKWGIIDTTNKTIQLAIYSNVEIGGSVLSEQNMPRKAFQTDMYVRNNGKVGMLKAGGEDFIPVRYDSLGVYSDSMLVAKVGGKYGFLNADGREAVPFIYSQAYDYSEGLAAVVNEKGKYLFIDNSGNVAIKPKEYDRVGKFTNGTCRVFRKDKVWEIDREGKKVKDSKKKVEADNDDEDKRTDDMYVGKTEKESDISKYDSHLRNFSDGLLPFAKNKKLEYYDIGRTENVSNANMDYVNTAALTPNVASMSQPNNIQLSHNFSSNICKYDAVLGNFSEGLLPVTKNKKLGYINAEGEEVIPCAKKYYIQPGIDDGYAVYGSFNDGLAQVYSFEGESGATEFDGAKNIKIGYMNKLGETVIPTIYDYADDFSEGKAYVMSNDFQGFIDTTGKRLFECKHSPTGTSFSDGLVLISDYDDGKYIFYNSEGKIALEFLTDKYSTLHGFNDGLAYYEKNNNETGGIGTKGFIDKSGKEVLDLSKFQIVNDFSEGLASVSMDGKMYGFINTKGDVVIPCKYKGYADEGDILYFHDFHDGVCLVEADDSPYFINKEDKVVLNVKKGLSCSDMDNGVALVTEYDNATNISTYGIVCLNGYNTLDHQDKDLAWQRIETLKVQQKIEAEKARKEQEKRDLEEKRRIEELQKRNSLQFGTIPNKFTSYADVFKLIYPSKKFYFNRASSIYGIDVWFKGYLEIRANEEDGSLSVYANGIKISALYNRGKNYETVDVKDKMARLFVRDSYDDYPLIIHLPDSKESKPYVYFEPRRGTDFRGDFDIRYSGRVLWQWVEPDVGSKSAHMIFHPTSEVEPTPIRYVMR